MRKKDAHESRKAHETYLNDQLSLGGQSQKQQRGHTAKEQEKGTKPEPKKTPKSEKDARGGGNGGKDADEKIKQQFSQKDRQLSGLAAQLRAADLTPKFKKKLGR